MEEQIKNQMEKMEKTMENTQIEKSGDIGSKPKKNVIIMAKNAIQSLYKSVFMRFPVTMSIVVLVTILEMIVFDYSIFSVDIAMLLSKIICFLTLSGIASLFTEEVLKNRLVTKITGWTIGAIIALGFTLIIYTEKSTLFDMSSDMVIEYVTGWLICYCTFLLVLSAYHMYREIKIDFTLYCRHTFCSLVRTTTVYAIIAMGLAVIVEIFDILIMDSWRFDMLGRMEVGLFGIMYVPGIIISFDGKKDEISKFEKIVIDYVLLILLMIVFAIIYVYMIKLLVLQEIPSNEVFGILTALFVGGLPIWTIAAVNREKLVGKIAYLMPIIYAPFIILQCICLGVRISDYGITNNRYQGIVLILFELIYLVLCLVKKRKWLELCIFVGLAQIAITLVIPGVNMYATTFRSQRAVLEQFDTSADTHTQEELKRYRSAYNCIRWESGIQGQMYLDNKFKDQSFEDEYLSSYVMEQAYAVNHVYFSADDEIDITGYSKCYIVYNYDDTDSLNNTIDISAYELHTKDQTFEVDLTEFFADYFENDEKYDQKPVLLPDGNQLYFDDFTLEYSEDNEILAFYGEGIFFMK